MNNPASTFRVAVHLFGTTSSLSCAPFCLKQSIVRFEKDYSSPTCQAVHRNFYVDNFLVSCASTDEGKRLELEVKKMLEKAGFHFTKWLLNNSEVTSCISEEERGEVSEILTGTSCKGEIVLGVFWDVEQDCFRFNAVIPKKSYTKRGVASMMQSFYDPHDFVAPVLVEPKCLMRELKDRD